MAVAEATHPLLTRTEVCPAYGTENSHHHRGGGGPRVARRPRATGSGQASSRSLGQRGATAPCGAPAGEALPTLGLPVLAEASGVAVDAATSPSLSLRCGGQEVRRAGGATAAGAEQEEEEEEEEEKASEDLFFTLLSWPRSSSTTAVAYGWCGRPGQLYVLCWFCWL